MDLKAMTVEQLLDEYWKPRDDPSAAGPAFTAWLHKLWRIDVELAERTGFEAMALLFRDLEANREMLPKSLGGKQEPPPHPYRPY